MEATPPGGWDPPNPSITTSNFDIIDQMFFFLIVAGILIMIGKYSDKILAFGKELYSLVSSRAESELNDKLTLNHASVRFDEELG